MNRHPTGSLTERLAYWNCRIAELTVRLSHSKLLGHATKTRELRRRLEKAERERERTRRAIHKQD